MLMEITDIPNMIFIVSRQVSPAPQTLHIKLHEGLAEIMINLCHIRIPQRIIIAPEHTTVCADDIDAIRAMDTSHLNQRRSDYALDRANTIMIPLGEATETTIVDDRCA